jgi:hypothetical protein
MCLTETFIFNSYEITDNSSRLGHGLVVILVFQTGHGIY